MNSNFLDKVMKLAEEVNKDPKMVKAIEEVFEKNSSPEQVAEMKEKMGSFVDDLESKMKETEKKNDSKDSS